MLVLGKTPQAKLLLMVQSSRYTLVNVCKCLIEGVVQGFRYRQDAMKALYNELGYVPFVQHSLFLATTSKSSTSLLPLKRITPSLILPLFFKPSDISPSQPREKIAGVSIKK